MYPTGSKHLKGRASDFTSYASIELALSPRQQNSNGVGSLGQKLKGYWEELVKKSPLSPL